MLQLKYFGSTKSDWLLDAQRVKRQHINLLQRFRAWLCFVKVDENSSQCNKWLRIVMAKLGNNSHLMKQLIKHGINFHQENL